MISDGRTKEEAVKGLLDPALTLTAPMSPEEQMEEKYGTGGTLLRMLGVGLSGGLLGNSLLPEMGPNAQKEFEAKLKTYNDQVKAQQAAKALSSIDPEKLTPESIALANEYGGSALGEYYTNVYAAQQNADGGDSAIAKAFDYTPYQWSQLSPETKRDLRDRYAAQNGGEGVFDYRRQAEGKLPEQLAEAEAAKAFGTKEGGQYGSDREILMNAETTVLRQDQGIASLGEIKSMLEDPSNEDLTGWPRRIRDFVNMNTREDGTLSAESASRVIELISQATFGALNAQELQLLKDGVLNPSKSREFNLGTIDQAIKRIENERERTLSSARGAADRYRSWDGQDDYDSIFKDDWLYNNVGDGSRVEPIPAFGGNDEYTFQQYVEDTVSELGPFDTKPSRDELVLGFSQMRKEAEEAYNEMIRLEKENSEAARAVRAELARPFPTVAQ